MKTIKLAIIALMAAGLSVATVNGQTKAKVTPHKASATKTTSTTTTTGTHLKKDGTPDKRYKENKKTASGTTAAKGTKATKATKPKAAAKSSSTAK